MLRLVLLREEFGFKISSKHITAVVPVIINECGRWKNKFSVQYEEKNHFWF